jgi:hypothetical protein
MRCTGLSLNTIQQHVTRGKFDPERLESVILYLAKHAADHFRQSIVTAAIKRDQEESVGTPTNKPRKRAKKTASRSVPD